MRHSGRKYPPIFSQLAIRRCAAVFIVNRIPKYIGYFERLVAEPEGRASARWAPNQLL